MWGDLPPPPVTHPSGCRLDPVHTPLSLGDQDHVGRRGQRALRGTSPHPCSVLCSLTCSSHGGGGDLGADGFGEPLRCTPKFSWWSESHRPLGAQISHYQKRVVPWVSPAPACLEAPLAAPQFPPSVTPAMLGQTPFSPIRSPDLWPLSGKVMSAVNLAELLVNPACHNNHKNSSCTYISRVLSPQVGGLPPLHPELLAWEETVQRDRTG